MNPVVPPRPEIAYAGVNMPSRPSSTTSHASERSQPDIPRRRDPPPVPPLPHNNADWEAKEEMRLRELEEAKARAAQMEKTMRWWSDCTANWREKWSKVRNERNKAREEVRHMRNKLETAYKDCSIAKREQQHLHSEVDQLKKQLEILQAEKEGSIHAGASSSGSQRSISDQDLVVSHEGSVEKENLAAAASQNSKIGAAETIDFLEKLMSKNETEDKDSCTGSAHSERSDKKRSGHRRKHESSVERDAFAQKLSGLQMRLDESQKVLQVERQEKNELVKTYEQLQSDYCGLKNKYEEIKDIRDDLTEQLQRMQADHKEAIGRITMELEDESNTRSGLEKRLADLRVELENLQAENAQEWGKRERLETEKLALERESKKQKAEISNLHEELDKKGKQVTTNAEFKMAQQELSDKNKEVNDLRHSYSKLKKQFQDKVEELEHACRRSEQYNQEVKKLRGKVEELKLGLANAEDELDKQTNMVRKLQRTNDEVTQQNETLEVQVDHLSNRLKRSSSQSALIRASSLKSFEACESTEGPSDSDGGD